MLFSSYIFLFLFLPSFLILYYLTPQRFHSPLILIYSLVFYGWWRPEFLGLLLACLIITYSSSIGMLRAESPRRKKMYVAIGVTLNLSLLGYFKYANFAVASVNSVLGFAGGEPIPWVEIALPIGLSFYIFQAISYIVDLYRGDAKPARNIIDFATFITMFPQLVAGPVLRYQDVADQFFNRSHTFEKFSRGATRFMIGFCRKVLIADSVAPLVNACFAHPDPTLADAWIGALAYTVQLYFDFAGYSDMAIGLGMMMGFIFPENFRDPYISKSLTEFWRRWHISLSTWLREYLYIPLGGNRKGTFRTYVNLLLTMLLGGLWHGANWTFLLWGAWHGTILAVERALGIGQRTEERRGWYAMPLTMLFVVIGWVVFRAPSVGAAMDMYGAMLGLNGIALSPDLAWQVTPDRVLGVAIGLIVVYLPPYWPRIHGAMPVPVARGFSMAGLIIVPLFIWAVATLAAQSFTAFLYYQF